MIHLLHSVGWKILSHTKMRNRASERLCPPESELAAVRQSHQTKSLPNMAPEGRLSSSSQAYEAGLPFGLEKVCV